jgi:hypothetical protein
MINLKIQNLVFNKILKIKKSLNFKIYNQNYLDKIHKFPINWKI